MKKNKPFAVIACLIFSLASCDSNTSNITSDSLSNSEVTTSNSNSTNSEETSVEESSSTSAESENVYPEFFTSPSPGYKKTMPSLENYSPSLFDGTSFVEDSTIALGDGVNHIEYSFNLNNSHKVTADVVEVDLTKASIATNYSVGKACVADSITDYESNNEQKVLAGSNGDFFGGSSSVNAYIKDQKIIKNSHNDNGSYDYTDLDADIPCSLPLLFGISGSTAQIAPIIEDKTVEETIKEKYTYKILCSRDGSTYSSTSTISKNATRLRSGINILESTETITTLFAGTTVYKVKIASDDGILTHGIIESAYTQEEETKFQNTDANYFYITVTSDNETSFMENDAIAITTGSTSTKWDGYTSVIGGRQALVEDGEVSSTVTYENSNGAQSTNIPRTCVGIKPDGKVLLVTIESLRYNSSLSNVVSSDSYGVNLPELAQFMRYIGCYDSVNFDGGGSTQLIVDDGFNGDGDQTLAVRSSDYGTYTPTSCRSVYNTILITTK
jgi:hypothetical protein